MKLKKQYCLLFSLVSFLSACSTTTQNSDQGQTQTANETVKAEVLVSPVVNENQKVDNSELLAQQKMLETKDQEINRLETKLGANTNLISQLNGQLDSQEQKITRLESSIESTKTTRLLEIEQEKKKLNQLEAQYVSLKLDNEKLNLSLIELKKQNRQYQEQILAHELIVAQKQTIIETLVPVRTQQNLVIKQNNVIQQTDSADVKQNLSIMGLQQDYDVLNKMHHTLLHKYSGLDEDYQSLDSQYLSKKAELVRLNEKYKRLDQANKTSKSNYAVLRQKNLDLGGAISDARAQQQSLWDQIQVKNKVIEALEADNSALRNKSATLTNLTSGQVTATLPVADNSLELGTLNAKILVLESEIVAQQSLLSAYQEKLTNLEQSDDKSDLKNIEIARLGQALADLNAEHDELNYQFEQLELAQSANREQQHELLQTLTTTKASLVDISAQKESLDIELSQAKAELVSLQGRYEASLLALESAKGTRQSLETQLSDLIELEAISAGFQSHLATSLSNVLWQIPKQVELGSSFEIILNANVNDGQTGQVFIAELISDSSLELVSSVSAEAQATNGQLQWRWRAKGVSESQVAQVNLFIHQDIQYQEDRVLKEVYRDQKVLSLVNDNFFEKYGFWLIAIFAGLMGGFIIGKLNKSNPSQV